MIVFVVGDCAGSTALSRLLLAPHGCSAVSGIALEPLPASPI
jgi:hypothetical protein